MFTIFHFVITKCHWQGPRCGMVCEYTVYWSVLSSWYLPWSFPPLPPCSLHTLAPSLHPPYLPTSPLSPSLHPSPPSPPSPPHSLPPLPISLPPSLSRSLPPSSLPPLVPSLLPHPPLLPPSHPLSFLAPCLPPPCLPTSRRPTQCTLYCVTPSHAWHWYNGVFIATTGVVSAGR